MSHEVNERIKEICYAQAEEIIFEQKMNCDTIITNVKLWFNDPKKYWEDKTNAKAMELYNNWRSND